MNKELELVAKKLNPFNNHKPLFSIPKTQYSLKDCPSYEPMLLLNDYEDILAGSIIKKSSDLKFGQQEQRNSKKKFIITVIAPTGNRHLFVRKVNDMVLVKLSEVKLKISNKAIWNNKRVMDNHNPINITELDVGSTVDVKVRHLLCKSKEVKFTLEKDTEDSFKLHMLIYFNDSYSTFVFTAFKFDSTYENILSLEDLNTDKLIRLFAGAYPRKYKKSMNACLMV